LPSLENRQSVAIDGLAITFSIGDVPLIHMRLSVLKPWKLCRILPYQEKRQPYQYESVGQLTTPMEKPHDKTSLAGTKLHKMSTIPNI
jgi:hypothetical protein